MSRPCLAALPVACLAAILVPDRFAAAKSARGAGAATASGESADPAVTDAAPRTASVSAPSRPSPSGPQPVGSVGAGQPETSTIPTAKDDDVVALTPGAMDRDLPGQVTVDRGPRPASGTP